MIDFDKLKRLFPLLNLLVIGLGLAKIVYYYKQFEINIIQYLELTESIILFFDDILKLFIFWFLPFIILNIFIGHKIGNENAIVYEKISGTESFWKRLLLFLKANLLFIISLIISTLLGKLYTFLLIIVLALYILTELKHTIRKYYNITLDSTYHNLIIMSIILTVNVYDRVITEVEQVRNHKYNKTTVYFKDKTSVKDEKQIIFLGKTHNFIFFYDTVNKESRIHPVSEIDKIVLKVNKQEKSIFDFL